MILVCGINHKTATVQVQEKLAAKRSLTVLEVLRAAGIAEAVVLSTCNRFELYAAAPTGAAAAAMESVLRSALERLAGMPLDDAVYASSGAEAIRHLFKVASGLDSLVLGEAEILGQVKQAYENARQASMTGKITNVLFQRALFVGKLVRSETGIATGHTSVASVAVDLAERIFGNLKESDVLVLGAGQVAELTSKHLVSSKIAKLKVANRTFERGRDLAAKFKAEAVRWEEFPGLLETVDIVITSTGSDRAVLTLEMVQAAMPRRKGRSLFIIDIAMPRDVEEPIGALDHVYLYAMKDLESVVAENVERRKGEVEKAHALVEKKAAELAAWGETVGTAAEASLRHS